MHTPIKSGKSCLVMSLFLNVELNRAHRRAKIRPLFLAEYEDIQIRNFGKAQLLLKTRKTMPR